MEYDTPVPLPHLSSSFPLGRGMGAPDGVEENREDFDDEEHGHEAVDVVHFAPPRPQHVQPHHESSLQRSMQRLRASGRRSSPLAFSMPSVQTPIHPFAEPHSHTQREEKKKKKRKEKERDTYREEHGEGEEERGQGGLACRQVVGSRVPEGGVEAKGDRSTGGRLATREHERVEPFVACAFVESQRKGHRQHGGGPNGAVLDLTLPLVNASFIIVLLQSNAT